MHRNDESVETKLQRIALKASKDKRCKFTSLFHLMNKELLLECFMSPNGKAASGIDNVSKDRYGKELDANLDNLLARLHDMSYRPQPVLRIYIPKPGSKKPRPLGIPALEDKLVQAGLVKILQAIYEQDFINDSYGFRPDRSCHDALRALSQTVESKPIMRMTMLFVLKIRKMQKPLRWRWKPVLVSSIWKLRQRRRSHLSLAH